MTFARSRASLWHQAQNYFGDVPSMYRFAKAQGLTGPASAAAVAAHRTLAVGALGAGVGAAIGAHYDHPYAGAAIGAAAGPALRLGFGASQMWKALPGPLKTASWFALGGTGLLAAGHFMPAQTAGEAWATDDGGVGYDYSEQPPEDLRQRMSLMNANGDLAFGLHHGRH